MTRRSIAMAVTGLLAVLLVASPATAQAATTYIYPGLGIGSARLGQTSGTAKYYMKQYATLAHTVRDTSYSSYTVYRYDFGTHLSSGKHQVSMYARSYSGVYRVFAFQVNAAYLGSRSLVTTKGIRYGSTATALTTAYGTALTRIYASYPYATYRLSGTNQTYFYTKYSKVSRIVLQK